MRADAIPATAAGALFSFGPYLLDIPARRLTRAGAEVTLGSRHFDMLCILVARAGEVVPKEQLIACVWNDVVVNTSSGDQALSALRKALPLPSGGTCIKTHVRRGIRFVPDVSRVPRRESDAAIDALLEPHRVFLEGRAALESLDRGAILQAKTVFENVLVRAPDQAPAHVGLANACALQFEMTRTDAQPDIALIERAVTHAREACGLNPNYGEAFATLGFVLERVGQREKALAAHARANALEPDNWRHLVRLSAASWGEARYRPALRALTLLPGLGMAYWLAATVLVARNSPEEARRLLDTGLASADGGDGSHRFSVVALHWLRGLIALAEGDTALALAEFELELVNEHSGHLYARECTANAWYAIGAARLRTGDASGARAAFEECLQRVPTHPLAHACLGHDVPAERLSPVEAAVTGAVACAARGDFGACDAHAPTIERLLAEAPAGNAGWLLPVEPMLNVTARPTAWLRVVALVKGRAA